MSSKKQITIDPSTLGGGGQQTTAHNVTMKRQRKVKPPVALLRPSTVKKNLLEKIKDYKRRNEETAATNQPQPKLTDTDLANQFKTSSNYLEQLMHKKKEVKKAKHSPVSVPVPVVQQPIVPQQPIVQMSQQPIMQMSQQPIIQMSQQPIMQMSQQPIMQMSQQLQSSDPEISLELPPELQINPIPICSETPLLINPNIDTTAATVSEPTFTPNTNAFIPQIKNDVPYGCLRNGNKPTYRTYHRKMQLPPMNHSHSHTLKKPFTMEPTAITPIAAEINAEETAIIQERQRKLRELQEKASVSEMKPQPEPPRRPDCMKIKIKQMITKKYKLGRTPGGKVVGVLIKNNETRRQVQQECGLLKREPIIEIRKYLHDHGLLKVGSDAPPDVLRNMYESAKLTGDVNNVNKNVILHNFMATADKPIA
jgi:hypothetical protein